MTLARELADTAGRPQVDKNLLINGGMNVWQRSTSVTGQTTTAYVTADRWRFAAASAGTWTLSRSTDVPSAQGFGYSYKFDCTTANASLSATSTLQFQQRIEGQNLQHLLKGTSSAKALTLSFWVKSNKTGTYVALLYDANNTRIITKSYTIDSASTWEKKTIVFEGDQTGTLDNDNAWSFTCAFWLVAGSNYTSGTQQTTWAANVDANQAPDQTVNLADSTSNEWYITGCQLEIGEAATGFQFEPYEAIYRKCLRYNTRWTTTGGNFLALAAGTVNGTSTSWLELSCIVPFRVVPTLTYSSLTHFDMEHFDKQPTSISLTGPATELKPSLVVGHSATTAGSSALLIMDTAGWLNLDAEL